MCVCVSVASSRHRRSSQSKSWLLGSTNREVNMTAGEVLFLERAIALSPALIAICRRNTNNLEVFAFEPAFLLRTPHRHKPSPESHSIYVPQAQENSLQSALHRAAEFIQLYPYVVRSCRPECDNARNRHEGASQVLLRAIVRVRMFLFFSLNLVLLCLYVKPTSNFDIFQVPLTPSPVTGRRLDYIIFNVHIGVTDVTKNSRLFTVTSTTCTTLLLAVFFPPIDIQHALFQHTQCPWRFVMLATKAL